MKNEQLIKDKIRESIQKIIKKIPKKKIFDSHYVIDQLIKNHSDDYLSFASLIVNSSKKTLSVHGLIGREIKKFSNLAEPLIEPVFKSKDFLSGNIHGNASRCTGWKRK